MESWAVTALPQIRVARIGIRRKERQNRPAANPQKIDRGAGNDSSFRTPRATSAQDFATAHDARQTTLSVRFGLVAFRLQFCYSSTSSKSFASTLSPTFASFFTTLPSTDA